MKAGVLIHPVWVSDGERLAVAAVFPLGGTRFVGLVAVHTAASDYSGRGACG